MVLTAVLVASQSWLPLLQLSAFLRRVCMDSGPSQHFCSLSSFLIFSSPPTFFEPSSFSSPTSHYPSTNSCRTFGASSIPPSIQTLTSIYFQPCTLFLPSHQAFSTSFGVSFDSFTGSLVLWLERVTILIISQVLGGQICCAVLNFILLIGFQYRPSNYSRQERL